MKKLYCCLLALLCACALTVPAFADMAPHYGIRMFGVVILLPLCIAAIAIAIIIVIIRKNKK